MNRPWNSYLGHWSYKMTQALRGEPVLKALEELEVSQHWPLEKLQAFQWERLQALVEQAYQVPFYRTKFDASGLTPSTIRTPQDFARLPILTKTDLRQHGTALRNPAFRGRTSVLVTSGSSGQPVSIWRSRVSTAYARAAMYRAHRWHGLEVGDREVRIWGEPLRWKGKLREQLKDRLMNRSRVNVYDLGPEQLRLFYREIQKRRPRYVFGYASLLDYFARFTEGQGLDVRSFHLRCVKSTSEPLRSEQSQRLERVFGCSVLNEYGCTETGIIATTCREGRMHQSPETSYVELVPVPGSPWCRVVVTDLHNTSMPLLRYDVGDLAQSATGETCRCGVALPLLGSITGRHTEIIEIPGGKKVHSLLLYYIICGLQEEGAPVQQARLIQHSPTDFLCQVVMEGADFSAAERKILKDLSRHLGEEARIRVESVPSIPRMPNGKNADFVKAF